MAGQLVGLAMGHALRLRADFGLSRNAVYALYVIAEGVWLNRDMTGRVSLDRIATALMVSHATAKRAKAELEKAGLIIVLKRGNRKPNGESEATLYRLALPPAWFMDPAVLESKAHDVSRAHLGEPSIPAALPDRELTTNRELKSPNQQFAFPDRELTTNRELIQVSPRSPHEENHAPESRAHLGEPSITQSRAQITQSRAHLGEPYPVRDPVNTAVKESSRASLAAHRTPSASLRGRNASDAPAADATGARGVVTSGGERTSREGARADAAVALESPQDASAPESPQSPETALSAPQSLAVPLPLTEDLNGRQRATEAPESPAPENPSPFCPRTLRRIVAETLDGRTPRQIGASLECDGLRRSDGSPWRYADVRRALTSQEGRALMAEHNRRLLAAPEQVGA